MNPSPENKKFKSVQYLVTLVLVIILSAMVAIYIYYGMYAAQKVETIVEPNIDTPMPGMDDAKRQEIINALNQEATSLSEEKKDLIIDSLTRESNQQVSAEEEAKRQQIIQSLQQN